MAGTCPWVSQASLLSGTWCWASQAFLGSRVPGDLCQGHGTDVPVRPCAVGRAVVSVASHFVWSCYWVRVPGDLGEGSAAGLSGFLASRVPGALNSATCARGCQAFRSCVFLGDFCQGPGAGPLRPFWGHVYLVTCVRDMVLTCLFGRVLWAVLWSLWPPTSCGPVTCGLANRV